MPVAVAAGLGAVLRYLVDRRVGALVPDRRLPWGTLAVNTTGCLALGALQHAGPVWTVGLLGGYTTLSALALGLVEQLAQRRPAAAAAYLLASVGLGWAAVVLGATLG